jgi:hypothetical protein
MADADDFNSSDLEFEKPVRQFPNAGQKIIAASAAHRREDRIESKKQVKTLRFTATDPGTTYLQARWQNVWYDFVSQTLKIPITRTPTIEMVIRFLDTTVRRSPPDTPGMTCPSESTIKDGWEALNAYFHFRFRGWVFTKSEEIIITSFFNRAVQEKRLHRGPK